MDAVSAAPLVRPLRRVFDVRALLAEAKAQDALVFLGHAERNEGAPAAPRAGAVHGASVQLPGDTVAPAPDLELRVRTPAPGRLQRLRNGTVVQQSDGTELTCRAPLPGVYRVEVLAGGEPWLFSSTILVTGPR